MMTLEWGDLATEVQVRVPWGWIPICIFIALSGFIIFNLIVAVVVEAVAATEETIRELDGIEVETPAQQLDEARERVDLLERHIRVMTVEQDHIQTMLETMAASLLHLETERMKSEQRESLLKAEIEKFQEEQQKQRELRQNKDNDDSDSDNSELGQSQHIIDSLRHFAHDRKVREEERKSRIEQQQLQIAAQSLDASSTTISHATNDPPSPTGKARKFVSAPATKTKRISVPTAPPQSPHQSADKAKRTMKLLGTKQSSTKSTQSSRSAKSSNSAKSLGSGSSRGLDGGNHGDDSDNPDSSIGRESRRNSSQKRAQKNWRNLIATVKKP